ncbi:unnamed protein product [Adineta ricciae]|uniref:Uncharacterized protein n=1 Tax=Adineta ricciae TaxID=249248 RepID=A0A815WQY1_ADIRI|nr:unnamed protein product [Adineta ricciae]CAF1550911.1 unnamed protein product [Adineta ricciae]
MDHIEENQADTPMFIFNPSSLDYDDEEFRAGYPFDLDKLDDPDELPEEKSTQDDLSSTNDDNDDDDSNLDQAAALLNNDYNKEKKNGQEKKQCSACKQEVEKKSSKNADHDISCGAGANQNVNMTRHEEKNQPDNRRVTRSNQMKDKQVNEQRLTK